METKIETIDTEQFVNRIVLNKADALVKISSAWSGAGQMLCHTLQDLALRYADKVDFFSIDYDANAVLSATYRVEAVPTILFFKRGTLVDKLSGLTHRAIISHKINQLIES